MPKLKALWGQALSSYETLDTQGQKNYSLHCQGLTPERGARTSPKILLGNNGKKDAY